MYKLVAFDLDETLFNDEHKIDQKNKEAIAKARDAGIKLVPCSGRGPGFLGTLYEDLDLCKDHEYSILGNGAIVIENSTNKIISCTPLPFDKAKELFEFGLKKNVCVEIFTTDLIYFYHATEESKERVKLFGNNMVYMENEEFDFLKDKTIIKVLFEKVGGYDYFHSFEDELKPIIDNQVATSFSSNRFYELNAFGVHKGIGLLALANHLGIKLEETIGIGDNYNDVGLIKDAGLGVAVANAIDEIKELADVVTKATNNESAIAEVIDTYIFNEGNSDVR